MNRTLKIVLIITACFVLLCGLTVVGLGLVGLQVAKQAITMDPVEAAKVGADIADFGVPQGYAVKVGMHFGQFKMVAITPADQGMESDKIVLMLMGVNTASTDTEAMQKSLKDAMERSGSRSTGEMHVVDQKNITVNGQPTTLTIQENSEVGAKHTRQVTTTFKGKSGSVMFMAMGQVDQWNDQLVDDFLASIH